jgi:hypothetical protein
MRDSVVAIGGWDNEDSDFIRLQDFIIDGESIIPIFADEAAFDRQTHGSGFEALGIIVKLHFSFLRGDEILMLNPGDPKPLKLRPTDLAEAFARGRELKTN